MLLAIDIGNTDTVFGISRGYELHFLEHNVALDAIEKVVLSSVVPDLTPKLTIVLTDMFKKSPVIVRHDVHPEVRVNIERQDEIGSDLVANAVAAYLKYRRNVVIVDFGTALTFTTINSDGEILGVAIAPGLKTAVKALFKNTAQLPEVPLSMPDSALGKNTTHAIQAGILIGYENLVRGMITRIRRELEGDCIAVATGGLSSIIETLNGEFVEINRNLTLDGLRLIGEVNG
jgi:type III pantothenate kinase